MKSMWEFEHGEGRRPVARYTGSLEVDGVPMYVTCVAVEGAHGRTRYEVLIQAQGQASAVDVHRHDDLEPLIAAAARAFARSLRLQQDQPRPAPAVWGATRWGGHDDP